VDLIGRKIEVLASPNAAFAEKELPQIRFMNINNPLRGGIFGRLVLPNGYVKGKRYPLIFTTYRAGTEFLEGAVGDEFPILPFAAAGFAVFVMDTGISNMLSDSGDLEFTLMRLKRPLDAMEMIRQQLAAEGVIDPERCAITGLSYGADIAAYAVAHTKIFKAASLSVSGLDPIMYKLSSVNREKVWATYGYPSPEGAGLEQWKKLSLALNAAKIVTPVLIQSPDSEAMASLETFKALKQYGVPVDWYIYTGEGHVKNQPLNKYYVYRRNLDWMKFWLKDEITSDPDKHAQYLRWRAMKETFRARQLPTEKDN
jgi:dipeptidyl aminopeptidase/acylaminoacyl peptidase